MQDKRRIAFLGAGNMATAMISGLIQSGYSADLITAVNRTPEKTKPSKPVSAFKPVLNPSKRQSRLKSSCSVSSRR